MMRTSAPISRTARAMQALGPWLRLPASDRGWLLPHGTHLDNFFAAAPYIHPNDVTVLSAATARGEIAIFKNKIYFNHQLMHLLGFNQDWHAIYVSADISTQLVVSPEQLTPVHSVQLLTPPLRMPNEE